jgi:hypothetical protein
MVTLCCFFLSSGVLWGIGAVALALLCCLLPLFIKKKGGYVRLCLILICLAVLLACVRGGLFAVRRERAEMLSGEFIEAELVVRDVLQQSSYSCELLVSVTVSDDLPHSLAVLRAESPLPFYLGDRISGEFYVENLAFEAYRPGVEYEYLGEGAAWLLIPTQLDALVLCESGADSFSARLGLWRATLCRRICSVVDGEGGVLLSAMLLGEREALSAQTVRDFRRIGTSHLLAISGLHLSILVLLLDRFLYLIGAGRRIRVALVLPAVLAYAVLVGGGFSVLRAALMLLVCYLALLLRADHDPLTALAVSAALILADKSDVRRSRVRNTDISTFDIHDRVNYSVEKSELIIGDDKQSILLRLTVDPQYSSIMDYFEIFLGRMTMCRRAAERLGMRFKLEINGQQLL